jgi:hypothetical protein
VKPNDMFTQRRSKRELRKEKDAKGRPIVCSWCGTNMRRRPSCPRGPMCEREAAMWDEVPHRVVGK